MAESNSGQDKTEEPTPKKLKEAREKGQIARSKELATAAAMIAAALMFVFMGDYFLFGLAELARESFIIDRAAIFDSTEITVRLGITIRDGMLLMLPLFLVMIVVAILANIMLGGFTFSPAAMAFKPEKLDPIKGLSRIFAWRGLMELAKGLAKVLLVGSVAYLVFHINAEEILLMGREALPAAMAHAGNILVWSFLIISTVLLVVVAVDVPFQVWDHQRQMRMTKEEVKKEFKQTEGSPEVKGRQRQIQREMAQRRMMDKVPTADVVVTNPTHYAVALRYDPDQMNAPVVVAKGSELVASRIRALAIENDVPVLSAPPLARALFFSTELDEAIPDGLYRAVAQILAYVYQLRHGEVSEYTDAAKWEDLPIPDEYRRDQ